METIEPLFVLLGVYVFLIGLCTGSFLNVASLRFLWGQDIVFMPSRCPKCKNNLKWYHNIPVLSYIFLRGKCAYCAEPISIQYPIVELLNALLYLAIYIVFGFTFKTLFLCILVSFFIVMSITDFKEHVVFDAHTYPIIVLGFLYNLFHLGAITIWESLIGALVGLLFFEVAARLGYLFSKSRAFGEGDTIIAMGLGAFFGYKMLVVIVILSFLLQALVAYPMLFVRAYKAQKWKNCAALVSCLVCIALALLLNYFSASINGLMLLSLVILMFFVLALSIRVILADIKNKTQEELFCLPFGPALVIGATVCIFYGQNLLDLLMNYLNIV